VDKILKIENKEQIRDLFFHSLKQSLHLIHGSTRAFTLLTLENQSNIWEGSCNGDQKMYQLGSTELFAPKEDIRYLPIRLIYLNGCVIQKPVTVFDSDKNEVKLSHVISKFLPHLNTEQITEDSFLIHGITIPLTAGIYDVWKLFHYGDMFLYIVYDANI
jgi:hypothetical protein